MFTGGEGFPIAGGAMLAGLIYAFLSLFVTGPLVGDRMVEKLDWAAQCVRHIGETAAAAELPSSSVPKLGCNDLLFVFGRDGEQFCAVHGNAFDNNPVNKSLEAAENAERQAQKQRMGFAVSRAKSRCECAVTTTLEERRVSLAYFAGSARLIEPFPVRNLESELIAALNTPACAMKE